MGDQSSEDGAKDLDNIDVALVEDMDNTENQNIGKSGGDLKKSLEMPSENA